MMLSIKVHTKDGGAAMRVKWRRHCGKLRSHGTAQKRPARRRAGAARNVPAPGRARGRAVLFIVNI
jgi:hypothetical protein